MFGLEETDHPESLLFDVTGSTHLFGGEQATVDAVEREFLRLGFRVQVALAPTVGAAWAACHFLAKHQRATVVAAADLSARLAPLPSSALRLPLATIAVLHELGIQSIGQLEHFPRASLPSRFGASLLQRLDQALGRQDELISCVHPQEPIKAEWAGEHPVSDLESLNFVCGDRFALEPTSDADSSAASCRAMTASVSRFMAGSSRKSATEVTGTFRTRANIRLTKQRFCRSNARRLRSIASSFLSRQLIV